LSVETGDLVELFRPEDLIGNQFAAKCLADQMGFGIVERSEPWLQNRA
jgi:hypothetical protein